MPVADPFMEFTTKAKRKQQVIEVTTAAGVRQLRTKLLNFWYPCREQLTQPRTTRAASLKSNAQVQSVAARAEAEALVVGIDKAPSGLGQAEVGVALFDLAVRRTFRSPDVNCAFAWHLRGTPKC